MKAQEAITAFALSEKIKSGLLWANQIVELMKALPEEEKRGAEKIIKAVVGMIGNEIHLAKKLTPKYSWTDVEKNADMALVMINSNVAQESTFHLTQALTQVTNIGQRSMSFLMEKGLL
ncbi:MAG: hypothetical protein JSW39_11655 [Desulfobacterales bacterium]|nr:MAG: hypothetical protein JSW39_11655 [Desulfobacterales bacterium]